MADTTRKIPAPVPSPETAPFWEAAARGGGVAPAIAHLAVHQLRRRELQTVDLPGMSTETTWFVTTPATDRRSAAAGSLRHFLSTPEAMRLLREPSAGMPPSRFRPPVYVTIWS